MEIPQIDDAYEQQLMKWTADRVELHKAIANFIQMYHQYPTYADLRALFPDRTKGTIYNQVTTLEMWDDIAIVSDFDGPPPYVPDGVLRVVVTGSRYADPAKKLERIKRTAESRRQMNTLKKRARQAGFKNTAERADLMKLGDWQKGRCWWCGAPLGEDRHIDHRIPIAKGGTNDIGNLVLTCPGCNLKKHDKMPWEFCGRLL